MARKSKSRIHFAGALYHVILRGNDRQNIFFQPSDRRLWEAISNVKNVYTGTTILTRS